MSTPWKERLEDPVEEEAINRVWSGIRHGRRRRVDPALNWTGLGFGLAAATLALLAVYAWAPREAPTGLRWSAGDAIAEGRIEDPVTFDDGSTLTFDDGAYVEVLENTGQALTALLGVGRTRIYVEPGGPRRWTLECGLAQVEVVGTELVVERLADQVRVEVTKGVVLVRSEHLAEGVRRVSAAESVTIRRPPPGERSAGADEGRSEDEPVGRPARERHVLPIPEGQSVGDSSDGVAHIPVHPAASHARVGSGSELEEESSAQSPPTLRQRLAQADSARAAGQPRVAERALMEGLAENPHDATRSLAWFTLGRLRLGPLNDPRGAATAFARARDGGLAMALREESIVRQVEAHLRVGARSNALALAQTHETQFPGSTRRAEIDRLLARHR